MYIQVDEQGTGLSVHSCSPDWPFALPDSDIFIKSPKAEFVKSARWCMYRRDGNLDGSRDQRFRMPQEAGYSISHGS